MGKNSNAPYQTQPTQGTHLKGTPLSKRRKVQSVHDEGETCNHHGANAIHSEDQWTAAAGLRRNKVSHFQVAPPPKKLSIPKWGFYCTVQTQQLHRNHVIQANLTETQGTRLPVKVG